MFKEYLILLLLGHIIGDFYVQTQEMAVKKDKSIRWVLIHCLGYFGIMVAVGMPFMKLEIFFMAVTASIIHFVINIGKYSYIKKISKKHKRTLQREKNIFLTVQILHICCLIAIAYFMVIHNIQLRESAVMSNFFGVVGVSEVMSASWVLSLLLIHKPTNIVIQKLLVIYRPIQKEQEIKKETNAGRFIGTIERIIMLLLIFNGQYAAIGLVLTAKSIARYDRIAKDKDFAEYYLLGTLMSTVIVILVANIFIM